MITSQTSPFSTIIQGRNTKLLGDALQVFAASLFIALCAQISIPLMYSPVPITGQTFGVLLVGSLLGRRKGVYSVVAYLVESTMGLPVLAGGVANPLALIGPTGGYLVGFIAQAFLAGWFVERQKSFNFAKTFAYMLFVPSFVQLLMGVAWLANFVGWDKVLVMGFYPFILGGVLKCVGICSYLKAQSTNEA